MSLSGACAGPVLRSRNTAFGRGAGGAAAGGVGGAAGAAGGMGGGEAGSGFGTAAPIWVRTDSPCSNCTRAVTSTSPASDGLSVSSSSLDVPIGSVPSSQTTCPSCDAGSGEARMNEALAGSGARTTT